MAITFHLDEHIPPAVAIALRHRGIDVTTTVDAGLVGAEDHQHLDFATAAGRVVITVVITQDADFVRLHAEGVPHAGIAYWRTRTRSLGDVLRRLVLIHGALLPEEMKGRVEYL